MGKATEVPPSVQHEPEGYFAWRAADAFLTSHPGIRVGQSSSRDPIQAVQELERQLFQPYAELVMFFCGGEYDLEAIAEEVNARFAGIHVVGCTGVGGIGPVGYASRSLCGVSFSSSVLAVVSGRIDKLRTFDAEEALDLVAALRERLELIEPGSREQSMFAFQMVDGRSGREEPVTRAFQESLGTIPLVGGSAGRAGESTRLCVFEGGRFHEDCAVLMVAASSLPFTTFCTHHLVGTDRRGVVTAVDWSGRRVHEIDGLPAAEGYARLFDVQVADLSPDFFASHPVVVRIRGVDYARGVGNANADGSLSFRCAIEEGVVLRCAVENDLVTDLMGTLARVNREIGRPSAILMCDSVRRSLEIAQLGLTERVSDFLRRQNAVGFSTHGSQVAGIHMNQALVGIAFSRGDVA